MEWSSSSGVAVGCDLALELGEEGGGVVSGEDGEEEEGQEWSGYSQR